MHEKMRQAAAKYQYGSRVLEFPVFLHEGLNVNAVSGNMSITVVGAAATNIMIISCGNTLSRYRTMSRALPGLLAEHEAYMFANMRRVADAAVDTSTHDIFAAYWRSCCDELLLDAQNATSMVEDCFAVVLVGPFPQMLITLCMDVLPYIFPRNTRYGFAVRNEKPHPRYRVPGPPGELVNDLRGEAMWLRGGQYYDGVAGPRAASAAEPCAALAAEPAGV